MLLHETQPQCGPHFGRRPGWYCWNSKIGACGTGQPLPVGCAARAGRLSTAAPGPYQIQAAIAALHAQAAATG